MIAERGNNMSLAVVTLKKGEGRLLKSGGMWVFDNEISSIMGSFVNGDIVLEHDFDGYPLGRGFINTNSKITVRLLTRDENQRIDEDFFERRVRDAWEYRKKVTDTSSCRLIFGEADFLPGLTVDKFAGCTVSGTGNRPLERNDTGTYQGCTCRGWNQNPRYL